MKNKKNNPQSNKSKSIEELKRGSENPTKGKKENPIHGMPFGEVMKRIVRVKPAKK